MLSQTDKRQDDFASRACSAARRSSSLPPLACPCTQALLSPLRWHTRLPVSRWPPRALPLPGPSRGVESVAEDGSLFGLRRRTSGLFQDSGWRHCRRRTSVSLHPCLAPFLDTIAPFIVVLSSSLLTLCSLGTHRAWSLAGHRSRSSVVCRRRLR